MIVLMTRSCVRYWKQISSQYLVCGWNGFARVWCAIAQIKIKFSCFFSSMLFRGYLWALSVKLMSRGKLRIIGIQCHLFTLSNLRRTAWSRPYGILVAPSVSTLASVLFTPCICTKNSVLILLAASLSLSPRVLQSASICSSISFQSIPRWYYSLVIVLFDNNRYKTFIERNWSVYLRKKALLNADGPKSINLHWHLIRVAQGEHLNYLMMTLIPELGMLAARFCYCARKWLIACLGLHDIIGTLAWCSCFVCPIRTWIAANVIVTSHCRYSHRVWVSLQSSTNKTCSYSCHGLKHIDSVGQDWDLTSSMNTMDGAFSLASVNSWLTSFSLSPSHFDTYRNIIEVTKQIFQECCHALNKGNPILQGTVTSDMERQLEGICGALNPCDINRFEDKS